MSSKSALAAALLTSVGFSAAALAQINPDEIIVSAKPIARATDEMVTSIHAMNADDITRASAASIGELLQNQPGVTSSSFAPGASRPIIRGLDSFRVRVLENGAGAQDVSALSEDHGIPLDPLSAQRIEIIRGPAVLRYGSAAIGGAVSVLNDRVPTKIEAPLAGTLSLAASPQDDSYEIGLLLDGGTRHYGWHLDAYKREANDYEIPTAPGKQPNSAIASQGFAIGGARLLDTGHIGLAWSHFESDYGIPASLTTPAAHGDIALDISQDKLQLSGSGDLATLLSDRLQFEGAYSEYTHHEIESATGDIGSTFKNNETEFRLELLHEDRGRFSGAIGLQMRDRSLAARGEGGQLLAPAEMTSFALFFYEDISLRERVNLELGARIEHTELKGTGVMPPTPEGVTLALPLDTYGARVTPDYTPASFSAGLVYRHPEGTFEGINAGLTWQYAERAPDILELFAKGPHEASETFEIGLPTARIEIARSLEFNIRREESEAHALSFDMSIYRTEFDDFLYKYETGFVCGDDFDTCGTPGEPGVEEELKQIVYSQQDATFKGLEASLAWRALNWGSGALSLGLRADQVRAQFDDGTNLPRIPVRRYGASLKLSEGPMQARVAVLRAESPKHLALDETTTPGYVNLTADLSYRLELASGKEVLLGISGDNLLDDALRNHTSLRKEEVLQPGRRVKLFIRSTF
ncbi:MAG: TonB-dependent receptor [Alphaproteobacteria bacterium]|nr:MAG: TonB-dependent receptor [Alphaproteobacteria bacterium]